MGKSVQFYLLGLYTLYTSEEVPPEIPPPLRRLTLRGLFRADAMQKSPRCEGATALRRLFQGAVFLAAELLGGEEDGDKMLSRDHDVLQEMDPDGLEGLL